MSVTGNSGPGRRYRIHAWCGDEESFQVIRAPSMEAAEDHARDLVDDLIATNVDAGYDVEEIDPEGGES